MLSSTCHKPPVSVELGAGHDCLNVAQSLYRLSCPVDMRELHIIGNVISEFLNFLYVAVCKYISTANAS
jgi:hypothetical protein